MQESNYEPVCARAENTGEENKSSLGREAEIRVKEGRSRSVRHHRALESARRQAAGGNDQSPPTTAWHERWMSEMGATEVGDKSLCAYVPRLARQTETLGAEMIKGRDVNGGFCSFWSLRSRSPREEVPSRRSPYGVPRK